MNRVDVVLRTPVVSLSRFDHPADAEHHDPEYETAALDSIAIIEAGSFDVRYAGERWRFGPGSVFLTLRGMEFSCEHGCETPDDRCLSVTLTEQASEDLRTAGVAEFRPPLTLLSARSRFLYRRLRDCGAGQEMRLELLAGALFESMATDTSSPRPREPGEETVLMRRVGRVIELIEAEFDQPLTLAQLARVAGLSPYHFSRVFRDFTGVPPHRFLAAVRLRHAARMLAEGASVTSSCYASGFGSLSHFVTAFRKRYGVQPSAARRGTVAPVIRSALRDPLWRVSR
jgi:AraC family transcriptional regulator